MKTELDMMMLEDLTNGDHAICFQTRGISTIFCAQNRQQKTSAESLKRWYGHAHEVRFLFLFLANSRFPHQPAMHRKETGRGTQ